MSNLDDKVFAIAGTVGVGKSTLAETLAKKLNINVLHETVNENPYLEKYYNDFERWGFHLQIFFLAERFKKQKKMYAYQKGFIMDRTIYEDLEIFAKASYENGYMSKDDWQTYKNLFESMVLSPFFDAPDLIIYIDGDLEKILDRIKERNREMEVETDISYWIELHKRYKEWIESFNHSKLLILNIDDYDVNNDESINKIISKIEKILNK